MADGLNDTAPAGAGRGGDGPRVEDAALLRGTARFIADLAPAGPTLEAAFVRSPHPHAEIDSVDASAARAARGVAGVLTGPEATAWSRPLPNILTGSAPLRALAADRVRYVGEPLAVVLADTRARAEDAVVGVEVTYRVLPAVTDPLVALEPGAPVLHPDQGSNLVHDRTFTFGDPDPWFARAHRVVTVETRHPRSTALPLETFGAVARYEPDDDGYTVWSNYGGPLALATVMAAGLGVPVSRLRLIMPDRIGGSFGIKQALYPYLVALCLASRAVGRPVRWIEDRSEHLAASSAGSERITAMSGAFDPDGRLRALRIDQLENLGAYVRTPEPAGLYRMHGLLAGPYRVAHIAVHNRVVLTNQVPSGLNRGFGAPQHTAALEALMDAAARDLALDRAEIRYRNLVPADRFPHATASGSVLDSGDHRAVLARVLDRGRYREAVSAAASARAAGGLVGVGLACFVETSGNNLGYMNVALDPDSRAAQLPKSGAGATVTLTMDPAGAVLVALDSPDCGQGYRTVAARLVAGELGLSPADVAVRVALDTGTDGWTLTSGNYANRFSTAVASACVRAARQAAAVLRRMAAAEFGCEPDDIELVDGVARRRAPPAGGSGGEPAGGWAGRALPVRQLAAQLHWNGAQRPDGVEGPLRVVASFVPTELGPPVGGRIQSSFTYSFQCDLAVVTIDADTGVLTVDRYVTVHDIGPHLHPGMVEGQVRGGFAHGWGAAVRECLDYAPDGSLLTPTLADYGPVRAADLPPLTVDHLVTPSPVTETGAKGVGDGAAVLAPAVLASAIVDALGLDPCHPPPPPYTPARLWDLARSVARNGRSPQ